MSRPLWKRVGYDLARAIFRVAGVAIFQFRCWGRDRAPVDGPVVICSNHQSFFDAIIVGIAFNPRLNYLARKSLFRFGPFGWAIAFVGSIPIDRDGMSISGLKETLRRLKRGEMVTIFAEGTRTHDGQVGTLKPGFITLARRTKASLLPVGIDGAFDAWPRTARLPRVTKIVVSIGEPISVDQIRARSDEELLEQVRQRMVACHAEARRRRGL